VRITLAALGLCTVVGCIAPNDFDPSIARRDLDTRTPPPSPDRAVDLIVRVRDLAAEASITLDADTLENARVALAEAAAGSPADGWVEYHAAHLAYLRMMRHLYRPVADENDEDFDRDVASAVVHAQAALASGVDESESAALLAAIQGQRISAEPFLGMTLGSESDDLIERALAAKAENPRAWFVRGLSLHFTPALFGGDDDKALDSFLRAIERFEKAETPPPPRPSWGHAEAHAWAGQLYAAIGRDEDALVHYKRALEIAPQYAWVEHVLIPSLAREVK
jgi:tetratricopeptide (TPR) repeat protein